MKYFEFEYEHRKRGKSNHSDRALKVQIVGEFLLKSETWRPKPKYLGQAWAKLAVWEKFAVRLNT
jgi:hypothetical protein